MEKIQVGEYARTRDGHIYRLLGEQKYLDKDGETVEFVEDIVKHSFNLIDLIEVSDYVNGAYVTSIYELFGKKYIDTEVEQNYGFINAVPENEVKSIVTHEQFASLEYKVEGG